MNFLNADVPDPTDFPPPTLAPGLRALDGSFRCDICGDLYDAPVTISCGHCFCSACIRGCLSNKQECPSCRKPAGEGHIRPNPIIEKVISDWNDARPFILQLLKKDEERGAMQQEDKGTSKKRKRGLEGDLSLNRIAGDSSHSSLSPSGKDARKKKSKPTSDDLVDMTISSSDVEEEELVNPISSIVPKAGEFVPCPICQKRVQYQKVNAHIDNGCKDATLTGQSAATTWSKIMGGKTKPSQHKGKHKRNDSDDGYPLPIQTYNTLKDKQLKDMLHEHDLPLTGDRSHLEQRHQRWITLYNANLDRSTAKRKTKSELRKDLKKWEEDSTKKKKSVIHDIKGYQIEHKGEFAELVKAARQSKQSKEPSKSKIPADDADTPSPPLPPKAPTSLNQRSSSRSSITVIDDTIVVDSEEER